MNTKEKDENRDSSDELVTQAESERQIPKLDVGYQRVYGCLGGSLLGFIFSVALFFVLLMLDQKFSKPTDPDFANLIGVIHSAGYDDQRSSRHDILSTSRCIIQTG